METNLNIAAQMIDTGYDDADAEQSSGRNANGSGIETPPIKCILMDDNKIDRQQIRRIAKKSHHSINLIETASIQETKERLAHQPTDILLADYRVPDGNGIHFAGDIVRGGQDAPQVIVVTGESDASSTIEAIRAGAVDFLPKSDITLELFDSAIENALRARGRTTLPDDMEREQAIHELKALKKTSLKNTTELKASVLPLIALSWQISQGKMVTGDQRDDLNKNVQELAQRIPALLDEIVIAAACGPLSEEDEIADMTMIVQDILANETLQAIADDIKISFTHLPVLKASPKRARFLIEALIGAAIQFKALGKRPEIAIGSAKDPKGNPIIWIRDNGVPLNVRKNTLGNQMALLKTTAANGDPFIWSMCQSVAETLGADLKISTDANELTTVMIRFPKSHLG